MVDRAAIFLGARADARVRLIGDDHLVHQRFVELAPEDRIGRVHRAGAATTIADHFELHGRPQLFFAGAAAGLASGLGADFGAAGLACCTTGFQIFTAGRTRTSRPFEPGTEPLTSNSCRSASTRTTTRLEMVRRLSPSWPGMRLPGNTCA